MKDPRSGPMAVVIIVLVLLTKFAALQVLLAGDARTVLLLAPVLGRSVIVLLLVTTPYVRPEGLGAAYADYLPRLNCAMLVLLVALATVGLLDWQGGVLLGVLAGGFVGMRLWLLNRLGGTTGDTLGAACELTETVALLVPALLVE